MCKGRRGRVGTWNHSPCRLCDLGGSSYFWKTLLTHHSKSHSFVLTGWQCRGQPCRELQETSSHTTNITTPSPGSSAETCLEVGHPMTCLSRPDGEVAADTALLAALFQSHMHNGALSEAVWVNHWLSLDCMLLCWLLSPLPQWSTCLVIP